MFVGIVLQVLLVLSVLIGCRVSTDKSNFMDKNYASTIKWACSVVVVFSHINVPEKYHIIGCLHFVCVTLFFLFSGYGLTYKYNTVTGMRYKNALDSIVKLVVPYTAVVAIKILLSMDVGSCGLYYMNIIILFYASFFIMAFVARNKKELVVLIVIFNIAYAVIAQLYIGLHGWGSSSLGFLFGVLLCVFKDKIQFFLAKRTIIITFLSAVIASVIGKLYISIRNISFVSNREFFLRVILSFCVIMILFALSTHLIIGNRFSVFMGKICMHVFMLHGVAIGIIDKWYDNLNPGMYMLVIVVLTLVMAFAADLLLKKTENAIRKIKRKHS